MSSTESIKILGAGKYLRLVQQDRWEWVERVHCTGVVILVAVTDAGKIVLVEQYRASCKKNIIELPAGLVGDVTQQERLEDAAVRELWEETGYTAERLSVLTEGPPSAGMSPEIVTFFLAEGLQKTGPGGGDESEQIVVHELSLEEAPLWLKRQQNQGKGLDPKVYAGLYFAAAHLASR